MEGLKALGARVADIPLYRTLPENAGAERLEAALLAGTLDWVTFSSSSTVKLFEGQLSPAARGAARGRLKALCLGPITAAAARAAGYDVALVSRRATIPDFLEAIEAHARSPR